MKKLKNNELALHKSLKSAHNPREVESVDKSIDGLVTSPS